MSADGIDVHEGGSVRLDMSDGSYLYFYMDQDGPVDKARIMVRTPETHGHGFRLSEEQTIALRTFFSPTRSST